MYTTTFTYVRSRLHVVFLFSHWRLLLEQLWARFETVMRLHIDSVRAADVRRIYAVTHKDAAPTRPHYVHAPRSGTPEL